MAELLAILLMLPVPALLAIAIWKQWSSLRSPSLQLVSRRRGTPLAGSSRRRGGGRAGQREPRRPRPFAGAGAAALPLPVNKLLDETDVVSRDRTETTRAWRSAG
jgi:hypothetical protein